MKRGLSAMAVALGVLLLLFLIGTGVEAGTDFSGKYYVAFESEPTWTLLIHQSDNDVTFTLANADSVVSGTGTVIDFTMTLSGTLESELSIIATFSSDGQGFSGTWKLNGDEEVGGSIIGTKSGWKTYNVNAKGIPRFLWANYTELAKIKRISKFRSGVGHDYSDDFETCRSMKHYFKPKNNINWSTIKIFSPITGTVISKVDEWAGKKIVIKSKNYPSFFITMFHVKLTKPLSIGELVTAGKQLGTHIGSQTTSDIAVGVHTPNGYKLVSYFDVMTAPLFQLYQARGLNSRNGAIISRQARDSDPLICQGQNFKNTGKLTNWVNLN